MSQVKHVVWSDLIGHPGDRHDALRTLWCAPVGRGPGAGHRARAGDERRWQPVNPENVRRDSGRLVKLASVPRIRIHDQPHTHVTLALASGANIKAISRRIGHTQTSLTMDISAHVLPEQHREVAD